MLNFIRKNKSHISQSQNLMKCVNKTNDMVDLEYKWPTHTKTKAMPVKFVYNDYHLKNTAAGYSRNYENNHNGKLKHFLPKVINKKCFNDSVLV